ncbi:Na+/H+ antiporter subunit A [Pontibacillus yanchengensis]|uniref:Na+/H+ antiporter subunit A n=2 Tax=Pontibacillus yanchengensis TaxID=462910 RepID=A0ACC7VDD4_9BACI|nr:Na+/H+ antiporter subunit A [Pontibacillus yanchengensis]MYL33393.1 Na+/H+ antiporter subunit A [Pontibacillus yanchengensis]MYL53443.1 Na+/H+ antiporter subunit A [Pontibacillus yanchengensis]
MLIAVFLPLIFACLIPFLSKWKQKVHTGWFVLPIPFSIFLFLILKVGKQFSPISQSYNWIPSLDINFDLYLDGLGLLFGLLISGIGTLVVLYSIYYLHKTEQLGHFYVYLLMFMAAMLGVVFSDNVYALYSFWELTSFSSFLLIGYWNHRSGSRYGALKSMLITVFGGLSLLAGLILLTIVTDTTSIQSMIDQKDTIMNSPYFGWILGFVFLGAFTKSAQFPFHIWLPDAMEAPTPVSAYLHSATMVKAGIFLVARFLPILSLSEWFFVVVSGIGIITLCWGSFMAVRQTDLKGILAFSTISQLGMIMSMLGFGTDAAIFAAVFHILNHATFKGSLFMVAGIVDHETGTRDIRKLGGLMTFMPITATLALFGTFSMAGVPLPFLNGFYSKEMFFKYSLELGEYSGIAQGLATAIPFLAVLGSIFTFVYSMYLVFGTFRGEYKKEELPQKPHEAPIGMLISPIILVIGIIVIGLFPHLVNGSFLAHAAEAISGHESHKHISFWHGFVTPLFMSLAVVGLGTLLVLTRKRWNSIYNVIPGKLSFNRVYDWLVDRTERFSSKITKTYMTGSLKLYVQLILIAIIFGTISMIVITNGINLDATDLAKIRLPELLVVGMMVLASIATIFTNNRIAAILILGVVGYGLSILFVLYRAPDLALTQLIIETVTVALFLLVFMHLPKLEKRNESKGSIFMNAAISISFGGMMTLVGISSYTSKWFDPISDYFLETSKSLGGGSNVVNVILVDMRGLDTLFEIAVLGIAALGIYGMIKLRRKKEAK